MIAVEKALEQYGAPVYVRHEIVHNKYVVQTLEKKGADLRRRDGGGPRGLHRHLLRARRRPGRPRRRPPRGKLATIDATCPLVTKVHKEAVRYAKEDYDILLIGHEGHEEVIGTSGEAPDHITLVDGPEDVANVEVRDPDKVVWLSQTTLSVDETMETVDALKGKFPNLLSPPSDDICYATQNRQIAVKKLAEDAELVIVVGSKNSSNSDPHGRGRPGRRRARRPPGRLRRRDRRGLAGGRHHGRPHLRRLRARRPGRRRPGVARRAGLRATWRR